MTYLCSRYSKNSRLYPKDLQQRAVVDRLLHYDLGSVYKTVSEYMVSIVPKLIATAGNVPLDLCAKRRFRSACAFAQSDQNLPSAHLGKPGLQSFFMRTMKINQTVRIHRLIWVFVRRTCPKVFLTWRHNYYMKVRWIIIIDDDLIHLWYSNRRIHTWQWRIGNSLLVPVIHTWTSVFSPIIIKSIEVAL